MFILNSDKPLWKDELWNCGLILGTNCLEKLGFSITYPNGQVVRPIEKEVTALNTNTASYTVVCKPVPSSVESCVSFPTSTELCTTGTPSTSEYAPINVSVPLTGTSVCVHQFDWLLLL